MDSLAPKAKVKRSGKWAEIDVRPSPPFPCFPQTAPDFRSALRQSATLVPGDLVSFKHGDVCPSDCRLTESIDISMDQAALTGESLPVGKKEGDECFS